MNKVIKKELPAGWRWVKLVEFMPKSVNSLDPAIHPNEIFSLHSIPAYDSGKPEIVRGKMVGSTKQIIFSGDVLLSKIVPHIRRTWVVEDDIDKRMIASTEWIIFRTNAADPNYLKYILNEDDFHRQFMETTSGVGGSLLRARPALVAQIKIPLPLLVEQRRIAGVLREQMMAVERARKAAEERLEASNQLSLAILRGTFNDKKVCLQKFLTISDIAFTCSGLTPSRERKDYFDGSIPWVKTGELLDGTIRDTEEHISNVAINDLGMLLLPKGTLLVAMYGQGQTRCRTAILDIKATINQACFAILPNEKLDTRYLQLWFRNNYLRLREQSDTRGGNQPNFNGLLLRKVKVPLPSIDVQRDIVKDVIAKLNDVDRTRVLAKAELEAINALPSALLRRAFNGEL